MEYYAGKTASFFDHVVALWYKHKGNIIGASLVALVLGFIVSSMWLVTNSNDPEDYNQFVIVRDHTIGENTDLDYFEVHCYGMLFRMFGPSYDTRIRNINSRSRDGAVEHLTRILTDDHEEYTIVEIIGRPE